MIRLRASGRSTSAIPLRWLAAPSSWLFRLLTVELRVATAHRDLRFRCTNALTARRACTLHTKEPGTIAWLDAELRPTDVFLDIGANIGVYALYAAQRLGPSGHVYAIEPHLPNAVALMENVAINGLRERVSLLTCALAAAPGPARFDYGQWQTGSSRSSLIPSAPGGDVPGLPATGPREIKLAQSVDSLVGTGTIRPPHVVKIDVDGGELSILTGMRATLRGRARPRTVQVECAPAHAKEIEALLGECGYALVERHATMAGRKRLAAGAVITDIVHNAVFEAV